jgi:2-phosphoglycolate phosphatase
LSIGAILFDLDGTLVDTAPDLVATLNRMRSARGRAPVPYAIARNQASNGALGLLRLGFEIDEPGTREALRQEFIKFYSANLCIISRFFIDLGHICDVLSKNDVGWGIVTNKPQALTESLLDRLGVADLPGTVVGGDRLAERKPHPAPLELAAAELGVDPQRCLYVGDAPRDIQAGRAAGMQTVAAAYGYIRPGEDPGGWGADAVLMHPRRLDALLARWAIIAA